MKTRQNEIQEKELLEWREKQIALRKKYRSTPAGFEDNEALLCAEKELNDAKMEYQKRKQYRFLNEFQSCQKRFAGRKQYLKQMEEYFIQNDAKVILYGIGGIGKTSLAKAYINQVQQGGNPYDAVLFLSYNNGFEALICDDVQLSISNLRYSKDKYSSKVKYFTEKMNVLKHMAEKMNLLIVIDDCNVERDKRMAEVFSLPCRMLVTTRRDPESWKSEKEDLSFQKIHVGRLETEAEWKEFIALYQSHVFTEKELQELFHYRECVNGHTLLMMLKIQGIGIEVDHQFLGDQIDEIAKDLFCRFRLLRDERQALCELAIMPVQGIKESFYYKLSKVKKKSIDKLAECLLVQRDGQWISLHPVIAKAVKIVFKPERTRYKTMILQMQKFSFHAWNQSYFSNQMLEPYIFAILKEFPEPLYWQYREYDAMITLLWIQGYYEEAKHYCKILFHVVQQHYGKYHQVTVEIALRVAAVYYNAMDFEQSHKWYVEAYVRMQQSQPFDQRYYFVLSTACAKLSREYRYQGQLENALSLIDEALEYIKKYDDKGIGNLESRVAQECHWMLNKARILWDMEAYQAGWELGNAAKKKAYEYWKETGKLDNTEFDRFLIKMMIHRGEYDKAEKIALEMMERMKIYRHRTSKEMISAQEHLAKVWDASGRYEEALNLYQMILETLRIEFPYQQEWISRIHVKVDRITYKMKNRKKC